MDYPKSVGFSIVVFFMVGFVDYVSGEFWILRV